jgi:hypothetical protein
VTIAFFINSSKGDFAMNRIIPAVVLQVGGLLTCTAFAAEPLVVELWPGKTPGDVGIKGEENSRTFQSASDDSISSVEHSVIMCLTLKRAKIPTELHVDATGEHDFGVRQNEKLPSSWTQLCVNWLRSQDLLGPVSGQ